MSFGFSAGDFITAGKLLNDIISSLNTVGGAKSEYQELIRELESLQEALRYLDRLDEKKASSKHVPAIKCAALACRYPLESFLAKIRKYEASLGSRSRVHTAKKAKDKLCWTFRERDDIIQLRAYISMHVDTINNMLLQHGIARMDLLGKEFEESTSQLQLQLDNTNTALINIQKTSVSQTVIMRTMHTVLGTLCKAVCGEITTSLQQLSHAVTMVCASTQQIETVVLKIRDSVNSVDTRFTYFQAPCKFEDAKGFVFPVPSEYSLDDLENIIAHRFRVGAGARDVQEGNYELCNTKKRSERMTAKASLRPGMAITMAIIIIAKPTTREDDSVCPMPLCESSDIAVNPGGGFRCSDCDVWFDQASKKRRRIEEIHETHFDDTKYSGHEGKRRRIRKENVAVDYGTSGIKNVTCAAAPAVVTSTDGAGNANKNSLQDITSERRLYGGIFTLPDATYRRSLMTKEGKEAYRKNRKSGACRACRGQKEVASPPSRKRRALINKRVLSQMQNLDTRQAALKIATEDLPGEPGYYTEVFEDRFMEATFEYIPVVFTQHSMD